MLYGESKNSRQTSLARHREEIQESKILVRDILNLIFFSVVLSISNSLFIVG